ncbi:MAG: tRNA pseudouridine(38-40) synthase TruA [Hyphomicrobiales bacterium]|nr:tRNA pseudouridine(38-40) synthase TruA [Hyphomicrobiales bacterium]
MSSRWKLIIEYDGLPFNGWQSQKDNSGVQDFLKTAIKNFSNEAVKIYAAGRTDSGVHALGQVVHFDLERQTSANEIREALNNHLKPNPIAVISAEEVSNDFHARFSALKRHYRYDIINRRPPLTLDKGRYWRVGKSLDIKLMIEASKYIEGNHDFTTFRSTHCQSKSPIKTIDSIEIEQSGLEINIFISAKSFLHNQVRSIVGSLKLVGEGKWESSKIKEILKKKDRTLCGPVAPSEGLFLTRVDY